MADTKDDFLRFNRGEVPEAPDLNADATTDEWDQVRVTDAEATLGRPEDGRADVGPEVDPPPDVGAPPEPDALTHADPARRRRRDDGAPR